MTSVTSFHNCDNVLVNIADAFTIVQTFLPISSLVTILLLSRSHLIEATTIFGQRVASWVYFSRICHSYTNTRHLSQFLQSVANSELIVPQLIAMVFYKDLVSYSNEKFTSLAVLGGSSYLIWGENDLHPQKKMINFFKRLTFDRIKELSIKYQVTHNDIFDGIVDCGQGCHHYYIFLFGWIDQSDTHAHHMESDKNLMITFKRMLYEMQYGDVNSIEWFYNNDQFKPRLLRWIDLNEKLQFEDIDKHRWGHSDDQYSKNMLCLLIEKNRYTIATALIQSKLKPKTANASKLCTLGLQIALNSDDLGIGQFIVPDFELVKLLIDYGGNAMCQGIDVYVPNSLFFQFMRCIGYSGYSRYNDVDKELNELYKIVNLFIKLGADLNEKDLRTGQTMIMQSHNDKVFELLYNNGAVIKNIKDNRGKPAWYHILEYITTINSLKILIENGNMTQNVSCNGSQRYPLQIALNNLRIRDHVQSIEYKKIVKYLIKCGFKVNFTDQYGNTSLFLCYDYEICKLLINNKNANIYHKNKKGLSFIQNYMYYAHTIYDLKLLQLLSKYKKINFNEKSPPDEIDLGESHEIALFKEKRFCNTLLMNLVVQSKKSIDLPNDEKIIKFYCQSDKCDVNLTNNKGLTALMMAVAANRYDYVEYLLKYGCDINVKNPKNGQTALFYANNIRMATILTSFKFCNMKIIDKSNSNVLIHNATSISMLQFYLSLNKHGWRCNVKQTDEHGNNLLIKMQYCNIDKYNKIGYKKLIEMLVKKYKMNINHKNIKGQTALSVAMKKKDTFKIRVLKQNGAS